MGAGHGACALEGSPGASPDVLSTRVHGVDSSDVGGTEP